MIQVTEAFKKRRPLIAGFAEFVNAELKYDPNMSLAEFAEILDRCIKLDTEKMLSEIIRKQVGEVMNHV